MPKKNQKGSPFQAEVPQSVQALRSLVLFSRCCAEPAQRGHDFYTGRVLKAPLTLDSS